MSRRPFKIQPAGPQNSSKWLQIHRKSIESPPKTEAQPLRKSALGLALAKTLHEVARQQHQLGDPEQAIQLPHGGDRRGVPK